MHITGTASGYTDLLNKLHAFLTERGSAFGLKYTGTGNGRLTDYTGGADSVAETYTLTATGSGAFSVVGSRSGDIGTATVGVAFSTPTLALTIAAGSTPFAAGDTFKLCTAPKWQALRAVASSEYVWQAPGNDGAQAIKVGLLAYTDGATYWNLRCNGYTAFNTANDFYNQPGGIQYDLPIAFGHPGLGLWAGSIPFWFVADGRRVVVVAKVNTVYQAAYLGTADALIDPTAFPYPLVVGGTVVRTLPYNSPDATNNSCFAIPGNTSWSHTAHLLMRTPANDRWTRYTTSYEYTDYGVVHPFYVGSQWVNGMSNLSPNLDGSRPLFPITLSPFSSQDIAAQLAGVHAVPGEGLSSEQRLRVGPIEHLVVQNVMRTGNGDYFTVALD